MLDQTRRGLIGGVAALSALAALPSSANLPTLTEVLAERTRRELERDRFECRHLTGFVRKAWHVLEPRAPLIWSWHLDALCQHLEAITDGRITRLLVNIPPGTSKSLVVSVLWPAWEWGPKNLKSFRYLATAYNEGPVKRDTRKSRDLILSEWYQSLWPAVRLTRTAEMSFANDATGTREGLPFTSLTSQRGDRLIIDDPHSTESAESVAERERTTRNFREGALNRLNDQAKSAIVIIMQRLHADDISGVALKLAMNFVHLRLPMEFEADNRCETEIGFRDPREIDGELLCPGRFPKDVLDPLRADMGSIAWAGQYQQRPTPREGGLFKRAWFADRLIVVAPNGTQWVRHWDLAASTRKNSPFTAGVKIGRMPDGRYVVGHVVRTRAEGHEVRGIIRGTAETDGRAVKISLPQDPGQAGKVQAADLIAMLAGFSAYAEPETGDKAIRAEPFAAQCEAGNVDIVIGAWTEAYLDELCLFPGGGSYADQVDASSGAFARLSQSPRPFLISAEAMRWAATPG
jgi:predicted phage terminase large subunit-like protein